MTETVQARLQAGLLTGLRDDNGICRFSAIPYACLLYTSDAADE